MSLSICNSKIFAILILFSAILLSLVSSKRTQLVVIESTGLPDSYGEEIAEYCNANQFECRNGECIEGELLCDGIADCSDQSDETRYECTKSELDCPSDAFRCDYGACVHEDAICNDVKDCVDNSDELLPECPKRSSLSRFPILLGIFTDQKALQGRITPPPRRIVPRKRRPTTVLPIINTRLIPSRPLTSLVLPDSLTSLLLPESLTSVYSFCTVPPQPLNGFWKLHRRFCKGEEDCGVPQGVSLKPGSQLVYTCIGDFMLRGSSNVYCGAEGNWTRIPICVATTCNPLNSVSRAATCTRFGNRVSCRSPILPYTKARVTCRLNYGQDVNFVIPVVEQEVECSLNGRWEPEPITCLPVCGVANDSGRKRIAMNGSITEIGAFPWHANVWKTMTPRGSDLGFRCSGTIINKHFIVTAGHCVLNQETGTTEDPKRLHISAQSVNVDQYALENGQLNPPTILKVKEVYRYCEYFSVAHGLASDIALIKVSDPFEFSSLVLPACLDISSNRETVFGPGSIGKIDGFGKTLATGLKPALQTLKVTRLTNAQCKIPYKISRGQAIISDDEFCAIYSNETTVCDWDSGGGLVAKKGDLWHLQGILSFGFNLGLESLENRCVGDSYSIYTSVSTYMAWIQDVLFNLERYKSYPSCNFIPLNFTTTTPTPDFTSRVATIPTLTTPSTTIAPTTMKPSTTTPVIIFKIDSGLCLIPPQPANGEWKLHKDLCNKNSTDHCDIPTNAALQPGSQLVCECAPGFRIKGNSDVFCGIKGRWSAIPTCVEITCSSLDSVSRAVTCYRSNSWVPCNSTALPKTVATLTCRPGYEEDVDLTKIGVKNVECNENGEWEPNPIACNPVCGTSNTQFVPRILNGALADVTEFPWHASLYKQRNVSEGFKEFICGATLIQDNLLLTAAHCVYDDRFKTVQVPENFDVVTGNKFLDYDSPLHDPRIVQKSSVKNIYVPCDYYGFEGNYRSDIAIIELREPFHLSNIVLPACLDVQGTANLMLEPGAVGKFAGFGKTGSGKPSATLLTTMIPYVSYSQCKMSQNISNSNVALIGSDKFCAGNKNGTAVCEGDSGGGLVFDNTGTWNLLGILSVNLGSDTSTGEIICTPEAYSLYTRVSDHMAWIKNVMYHLERDKTYPSCGSM